MSKSVSKKQKKRQRKIEFKLVKKLKKLNLVGKKVGVNKITKKFSKLNIENGPDKRKHSKISS